MSQSVASALSGVASAPDVKPLAGMVPIPGNVPGAAPPGFPDIDAAAAISPPSEVRLNPLFAGADDGAAAAAGLAGAGAVDVGGNAGIGAAGAGDPAIAGGAGSGGNALLASMGTGDVAAKFAPADDVALRAALQSL